MEKDKIQNILLTLYSAEIAFALGNWHGHPDKSFINAWHTYFEKSIFTHIFDKDTKEELPKDKSNSRKILQDYLRHASNMMVIQAFVYAYDNMKNNLKEIKDRDKFELELMKYCFVEGDVADEKLINIMRNDIAHNDDEGDKSRFTYNSTTETVSFGINDNPNAVTLTITQLIHLVRIYMKNAESARSDKYYVALDFRKFLENNKYSADKLIRLLDVSDGMKTIVPDYHQIKTLEEIASRIKKGVFVPSRKYPYFYPHKDSSINNCCRLLQSVLMLDSLYENRAMDSNSFGGYIQEEYGENFNDMNSLKDLIFPILSNLLFQICSPNLNSFIQKCADDADIDIDARRIRNSLMHGTFFYDRDNSFIFYDGRQKEEVNLEYVGSLNFKQIMDFYTQYRKNKLKDTPNTLYSIGSEDIPYAHKVDFNEDFLK